MRALFYHPGGAWTGEARAFAAAAAGLAARGWYTRLLAPAASPAAARAAAAAAGVAELDDAATFVGAVSALTRALRDHRADVVFVHGESAQARAAAAAWRADGPAVVRRVPAGPPPAALGAAGRAALRTAPTGYLCTWAEQAAAVPPRARAHAVVADLGVDTAAPPPPPNGEHHTLRVVCAYEPTVQLRAATVLRAAAMLAPRHPDLRVVLAGPGATDEALRLHAAALGIHRIVRVHEPRDDGPPVDLHGAAVAWVLAERDDGAFGALDAMAAGVPVLAERGSAGARYVADAITGQHLAPGDVPGTAAALAGLLANPDARRAMGQAGRARATRSYTGAAMVDGFARAAEAAHALGARAGA